MMTPDVEQSERADQLPRCLAALRRVKSEGQVLAPMAALWFGEPFAPRIKVSERVDYAFGNFPCG
jgi:hypothetical protein